MPSVRGAPANHTSSPVSASVRAYDMEIMASSNSPIRQRPVVGEVHTAIRVISTTTGSETPRASVDGLIVAARVRARASGRSETVAVAMPQGSAATGGS